jgi:hypothetical protein
MVRAANVQVARMALMFIILIAKDALVVLEQPASSIMKHHRRMAT